MRTSSARNPRKSSSSTAASATPPATSGGAAAAREIGPADASAALTAAGAGAATIASVIAAPAAKPTSAGSGRVVTSSASAPTHAPRTHRESARTGGALTLAACSRLPAFPAAETVLAQRARVPTAVPAPQHGRAEQVRVQRRNGRCVCRGAVGSAVASAHASCAGRTRAARVRCPRALTSRGRAVSLLRPHSAGRVRPAPRRRAARRGACHRLRPRARLPNEVVTTRPLPRWAWRRRLAAAAARARACAAP